MNFIRNFSVGFQNLLALSMVAVLVAACGGGNTATSNVISGVASKGPLNGATVCAYAITASGAQGAQIGNCATTDAVGNYKIDFGSYTGPVLFQATSGTYVDEAPAIPLRSPRPCAACCPT